MAVTELAVLQPKRLPEFVETEQIKKATHRSLSYLSAGFPLHLRGTSGTGKTTLAIHIASLLGQPVVLIHGDEEFSTSDLIGGTHGYRYRKVVDRFVSRVKKVEEDMDTRWIDSRLTLACKNGLTLVYDEYTRSRPEANNIFLSILQEKILDLPVTSGTSGYLRVHPNFRAIFTSNPEEYAGVHRSQDALRDRMITIDLDYFDFETEVAITAAKSGLSDHDAEKIVAIVRDLREMGDCEFPPTIRGCLKVAKTIKVIEAKVSASDSTFKEICFDVLASETCRVGGYKGLKKTKALLEELISKYC